MLPSSVQITQIKRRLLAPLGQRPRFSSRRDAPAPVFQVGRLRPRARLRWLAGRLWTVPALELARRIWRELGDDHAVDLAASIAYYSILSVFPLAIVLLSVFSLVLESDAVEREMRQFFHTYLPGSHNIVSANVEAVSNIRGILGVVSLLGLLWSASLIFGAVTRAVNRAWDIDHDLPFYIEKPLHILMAVSVAPLFLMSVATTTALQVLGNEDLPLLGRVAFMDNNGINALVRPVPFLFSLAIFLLIYKFAPHARTRWRFIWPGALLAALLFEAGKSAFVFYLETFGAYERVYGSLASVIVLLAWVYLSGFILVIGAEFSSEYERMRLGLERGSVGSPAKARRRRRKRRRR